MTHNNNTKNSVNTELTLGGEKRDRLVVIMMSTVARNLHQPRLFSINEISIPEDFYDRDRDEAEMLSGLLPHLEVMKNTTRAVRCTAPVGNKDFKKKFLEAGVKSGALPRGADFLFVWADEDDVEFGFTQEAIMAFWYSHHLNEMRDHFVINKKGVGSRFRSVIVEEDEEGDWDMVNPRYEEQEGGL